MNKSAFDYWVLWLCGLILGLTLGYVLLRVFSRFSNTALYLHKLAMWSEKPLANDLVFLVNHGKWIKIKGKTHS